MFQDIAPHQLAVGYKARTPEETDFLVACRDNAVLVYDSDDRVFPTFAEARHSYTLDNKRLVYLFEIDGRGFFLLPERLPETEELKEGDIRVFRQKRPAWLCFAGATAVHLARWYENNRFCGRCGQPTVPSETERAMHCPACGLTIYPRINPVIIVGITNGNQLLLTKAVSSEYRNYALVAGFMEIGETLEDTVRREIAEEVGLKVKNIRYYKSQPWAFSESLLAGFFADVDGNPEARPDGEELSEAVWFDREDLPADDTRFSLTWEMIEQFRLGKV